MTVRAVSRSSVRPRTRRAPYLGAAVGQVGQPDAAHPRRRWPAHRAGARHLEQAYPAHIEGFSHGRPTGPGQSAPHAIQAAVSAHDWSEAHLESCRPVIENSLDTAAASHPGRRHRLPWATDSAVTGNSRRGLSGLGVRVRNPLYGRAGSGSLARRRRVVH